MWGKHNLYLLFIVLHKFDRPLICLIDNNFDLCVHEFCSGVTIKEKILIEINLEGKYEDFYNWLAILERSSTLIDVESIRGIKNNINNSEVISFAVKMYAYGINID